MERVSFTINRALHYIGCAALVAMMLLTVADVIGRYFFNAPVPGAFELTELAMVFVVFLVLGFAQHHGDHIALDVAYNHFPPAVRLVTDLLTNLVYLVLVAVLGWQLYGYAGRMARGGYETGVLSIPLQPMIWVALLGVAGFLLAIGVTFLHVFTRRGER